MPDAPPQPPKCNCNAQPGFLGVPPDDHAETCPCSPRYVAPQPPSPAQRILDHTLYILVSTNFPESDQKVCLDEIRAALKEMEDAHEWRNAVLDRAAVLHLDGDDPRKLMEDILRMEVTIALDPAVSSEAVALIAAERAQAVARIEALRPSPLECKADPRKEAFDDAIVASLKALKGDQA